MKTELLDLKFESDDLGRQVTIREYFYELIKALWEEGESFSGKRPLGNSGWEYDLYKCLIKNKIIEGKLDSDGFVEELNTDKAYNFVLKKIIPLLNRPPK